MKATAIGSHVSNSKDLLMLSLAKFYGIKSNITKILPIIDGTSDISLRLIDWFVTNFSKKYSTVISTDDAVSGSTKHFNVYLSYRSQLKAYSKQQFDPFRRRDRITFYYTKDEYIETTIGQLNFFRWVLENNILDFVSKEKDYIENDMITSQKENQRKKCNIDNIKIKVVQNENGDEVIQRRKKRNELSKSFVKNMNHFHGTRTIAFD